MAHLEQKKKEIEAAWASQAPGSIESDMEAYPDVSDALSNVSDLTDEEIEEAARQAIASVCPRPAAGARDRAGYPPAQAPAGHGDVAPRRRAGAQRPTAPAT